MWADKDSEFYKRSLKSRQLDSNIEIYLTHNKGKFVVVVRFIRNLKNKICEKHDFNIKKYVY